MIDGYDGERGAVTAGGRGYYLKVELVSVIFSCYRSVFPNLFWLVSQTHTQTFGRYPSPITHEQQYIFHKTANLF